MGSLSHLQRLLRALLTDQAYFWPLACLVIAADAVLTQIIIRFVSCQKLFNDMLFVTELDTAQTQKLTGKHTWLR
jgi:hypothetical protein